MILNGNVFNKSDMSHGSHPILLLTVEDKKRKKNAEKRIFACNFLQKSRE
jgi:hypothetical protein